MAPATPATIHPDPDQLRLVALTGASDGIEGVVETRAVQAPCPSCGQLAGRVHSRYVRQVADLPWHGAGFRLRVHVRRFFCDQPTCARSIFTERLPGFVAPYGRRTLRLARLIELVGMLVGGAGGSRLLRQLGVGGVTVGRDTLLRAVRRAPLPAPAAAPRVLSVDDFAFRRGRTFGTIVVDLERHRVLDLLPEATGDVVAAWLHEHPQVQTLSRDRGGTYAEGATRGAPQARQVADRFHLLKNLTDALDRLLLRHHQVLHEAAQQASHETAQPRQRGPERPAAPSSALAPVAPPRTQDQDATGLGSLPGAKRLERRRARTDAILQALHDGVGIRAIAARLGLARNTVRRIVRAGGDLGPSARPHRSGKLTPFIPYLQARWEAGEQDSGVLLRAITARGYTGKGSILRHELALWRRHPPTLGQSARTEQCPGARGARPFTPRQTRWLLLDRAGPGPPDARARAYVRALLERCPTLRVAQRLATDFFQLVRTRNVEALSTWLGQAQQSSIVEFVGFATGVRRDEAAVVAALQEPWSQGQTEGQVNRLKVLKRQMYGRAKPDLLRCRMLYQTDR